MVSHILTKKSEDHEAPVTSGGGTVSVQHLKGMDSGWWEMIELSPLIQTAPDAILHPCAHSLSKG